MELALIAFGFALGALATLGAVIVVAIVVGWVFPLKDGPG